MTQLQALDCLEQVWVNSEDLPEWSPWMKVIRSARLKGESYFETCLRVAAIQYVQITSKAVHELSKMPFINVSRLKEMIDDKRRDIGSVSS